MEKDQLTLIGIIVSAVGAVLFFGTWMEIRYYDYYGPAYISLNGIDVLSAGTNSFIILCIPLIVAIIFLVMIVQYYKAHKGIKRYAIIACVVIFFITWLYNAAVSGHIEDKYFDEFHDAGYASHLSFLVSLINLPVAFILEGKLEPTSTEPITASFDPPEPQEELQQQSEETPSIRFCPGCGFRLNDSEHQTGICSHCGMRFRM